MEELDIWGNPIVIGAVGEPIAQKAYNQALLDADAELAKYLGPTHNARKAVAALRRTNDNQR